MQILFADDQADTRSIFVIVFKLRGHTGLFCANGAEAVATMRTHACDIVVLDIEMPVLDGLTASREIRRLPHGQHVPIVLFTGYPYDDSIVAAAGANLLLRKPMQPFEMLERLEALYQLKAA